MWKAGLAELERWNRPKKEGGRRKRVRVEIYSGRKEKEEEEDRISDPEQWTDRRHELRIRSNTEHSGTSTALTHKQRHRHKDTHTHIKTTLNPTVNNQCAFTISLQIHSLNVLPGTMETVSLSQDTTLTYSCTAAGMRHLNTATLPRIERWSATRTV